jgi:hypothetical protein
MELQLAVRRYLLVSSTLFVVGLLGLAYALVGERFGNLLTREVLLATGLSLFLAGGWQFWALAITQYRADRQSDALASQLEMMAAVAQHTGSRQTRHAAAQGDWVAAAGWAHQLKSSAASVGTEELAQASAVAERHWRTPAAVADEARSA